jgi:superoxide dismutase, Fe-Mn family
MPYEITYEHRYHMEYGAAAAKYVDALMENTLWENASRLHREHAR